MVVGFQSSGPGEILHSAVGSHECEVFLRHVDDFGEVDSRRPGDVSSVLHVDLLELKPVCDEDVFVQLLDSSGIGIDIDILLIRMVGDSESPAEIDEFKLDPGLFPNEEGELEEHLRGIEVLLHIPLVGDDHRVEPESPDSFRLEDPVHLQDLLGTGSEFREFRLSDSRIGVLALSRIIPAAYQVG